MNNNPRIITLARLGNLANVQVIMDFTIKNKFDPVARLGRNQRYESWRMPYAHSSLGIPRLVSNGVSVPRADKKGPN